MANCNFMLQLEKLLFIIYSEQTIWLNYTVPHIVYK